MKVNIRLFLIKPCCFEELSKEKQKYYVDGKFFCPKCGVTFTRWANIKRHLQEFCKGTGKIKRNNDSKSETKDIDKLQTDNFEPSSSDLERLSVLIQNDHNFVALPHDGIKLEDSGIIDNQNNDDPLAM